MVLEVPIESLVKLIVFADTSIVCEFVVPDVDHDQWCSDNHRQRK